jgi:integrase/recombinase XerC
MVMVEDFIKYLRYEKNYSTHTVLAYKNDLNSFTNYLESRCGIVNVSEVSPDLVRFWMIDLMEKGLSARSMNRKLSALKSFWRFLLRRGLVENTPLSGIIPPKASRPLPVFLKESEMETLFALAPHDDTYFPIVRDNLVLELLYATGMRLSELVGLTDEAVDVNGGLLKVNGKRNKQRLIPFGSKVKASIQVYLDVRKDFIPDAGGYFLVRNDGRPMSAHMVYRLVHERLSQVGTLSKNSPHVLRHTFATALLNRGAELNAVKELLGHSSLSATEVYTHTSFAELKKVYKQAHPRA